MINEKLFLKYNFFFEEIQNEIYYSKLMHIYN